MEKVKEIDLKEESGNIDDNLRKERWELKDNLEKVILKEEISWRQKARIKWVREWDNNSKLFHKIVNMKKCNNLINKLEKDNGKILEEEESIVNEIIAFFGKLDSIEKKSKWKLEGLEWSPVEATKAEWLERPFE